MRILLLTPPFVQPNTPYPATPVLTSFLRDAGHDCRQADLSLTVALDVLRAFGDEEFTDTAISFLQGRNDAAAELLATSGYLPEGPSFAGISPETHSDDVRERAKLRASLHLDDLARRIRETADPDFGFSRYAESLGVSMPDFGALLARLRRTSPTDRFLDARTRELLARHRPDVVGVTCPFPGTLLGAFRIARTVRRHAPRVRLILGGGYVNTELRDLSDPRVGRFFDAVSYDEGYAPFLEFLGEKPPAVPPAFVKPCYDGLDLAHYVNVAETANPMHRLWSDGKWLKLQLAHGCYWHRCAFCDTSLDYVARFAVPPAATVADAMEALARETGETGFHFTDEAMPPAAVERLCREILRRGFRCRWWGNVRFDSAFTPALAKLMRRAGCIAVTGGLECATDRLLALMNKGITLASAQRVLAAFKSAGILVHAYLMYGFPTQTAREAEAALAYVRDRFAAGELQSAFFHRFALTVHSPVAAHPERFGIVPGDPPPAGRHGRFALNEIPFSEKRAPNWNRLGKGLSLALHNYMLGLGLDRPASFWLRKRTRETD